MAAAAASAADRERPLLQLLPPAGAAGTISTSQNDLFAFFSVSGSAHPSPAAHGATASVLRGAFHAAGGIKFQQVVLWARAIWLRSMRPRPDALICPKHAEELICELSSASLPEEQRISAADLRAIHKLHNGVRALLEDPSDHVFWFYLAANWVAEKLSWNKLLVLVSRQAMRAWSELHPSLRQQRWAQLLVGASSEQEVKQRCTLSITHVPDAQLQQQQHPEKQAQQLQLDMAQEAQALQSWHSQTRALLSGWRRSAWPKLREGNLLKEQTAPSLAIGMEAVSRWRFYTDQQQEVYSAALLALVDPHGERTAKCRRFVAAGTAAAGAGGGVVVTFTSGRAFARRTADDPALQQRLRNLRADAAALLDSLRLIVESKPGKRFAKLQGDRCRSASGSIAQLTTAVCDAFFNHAAGTIALQETLRACVVPIFDLARRLTLDSIPGNGSHAEECISQLAVLAFHVLLVQTEYGVCLPQKCAGLVGMQEACAMLQAHGLSSRQPERFLEGLCVLRMCGHSTSGSFVSWQQMHSAAAAPSAGVDRIYPSVLQRVCGHAKLEASSSQGGTSARFLADLIHFDIVLLMYAAAAQARLHISDVDERCEADHKRSAALAVTSSAAATESAEVSEGGVEESFEASAAAEEAFQLQDDASQAEREGADPEEQKEGEEHQGEEDTSPMELDHDGDSQALAPAPPLRATAAPAKSIQPARAARAVRGSSQARRGRKSSPAGARGSAAGTGSASGQEEEVAQLGMTPLSSEHKSAAADSFQQHLEAVSGLPNLVRQLELDAPLAHFLPMEPLVRATMLSSPDPHDSTVRSHPLLFQVHCVDRARVEQMCDLPSLGVASVKSAALFDMSFACVNDNGYGQRPPPRSVHSRVQAAAAARSGSAPAPSPPSAGEVLMWIEKDVEALLTGQPRPQAPANMCSLPYAKDVPFRSMKKGRNDGRNRFFQQHDAALAAVLAVCAQQAPSLPKLLGSQEYFHAHRALLRARFAWLAHHPSVLQAFHSLYPDQSPLHRELLVHLSAVDFEGVSSSYLYVKSGFQFFNLHVEQLLFTFVHQQLTGSSEWILLEAGQMDQLRQLAAQLFGAIWPQHTAAQEALAPVLLMSKSIFPSLLLLHRHKIRFTRRTLSAGQVLIARGDCAHFGFSTASGNTVSFACNVVTEDNLATSFAGLRSHFDYLTRLQQLLASQSPDPIAAACQAWIGLPALQRLLPPAQLMRKLLTFAPPNFTCGWLRGVLADLRLLRRSPCGALRPVGRYPALEERAAAGDMEQLDSLIRDGQWVLDALHQLRPFFLAMNPVACKACADKSDDFHHEECSLCICTLHGWEQEHWDDDPQQQPPAPVPCEQQQLPCKLKNMLEKLSRQNREPSGAPAWSVAAVESSAASVSASDSAASEATSWPDTISCFIVDQVEPQVIDTERLFKRYTDSEIQPLDVSSAAQSLPPQVWISDKFGVAGCSSGYLKLPPRSVQHHSQTDASKVYVVISSPANMLEVTLNNQKVNLSATDSFCFPALASKNACSMRNVSDTQSIGLHWVSLPCHAASTGPPNAISTNSTAAAPTSAQPEALAPAPAAVTLDTRKPCDSALNQLAASLSHATLDSVALRGGGAAQARAGAGVPSAAAKPAPVLPPAAVAAAALQPCVQVRVVGTNGEYLQCFYHAVGLALGCKAQRLSGAAADSVRTWPDIHQWLREGISQVQDSKVLDKFGFSLADQPRALGTAWGDTADDKRNGYLGSQSFLRHQWGGHREMHLLSLRLGINFRTFAFQSDETGPGFRTAVVSAAGAGAGERRVSHQVLLRHVSRVHWELIVLTVDGTEYLRWPLENSPLSEEQLGHAVYAHLASLHGVAPEAAGRLVPPTPVQMQTAAEGISLLSDDSCSERSSSSQLHKSTASRVVPVAAGSATRKRKSATPSSGAGPGLGDAEDAHADEASVSPTCAAAAAPAASKRRSAGQLSVSKESCSSTRMAAGQPVMYDSTSDWDAGQYGRLRTRLLEHGFLLIRRAFDSSVVANARQAFFSQLCQALCSADATAERPTANGIPSSGRKQLPAAWAWDAETGVLNGEEDPNAKSLGLSDAMRKLYADEVTRFARMLCGNSAGALKRSFTVLTQCTWMRALREGGSTQEHSDLGYFLRRTDHLVQYYRGQADVASLGKDAAAAAATTAAAASRSSVKSNGIGRRGCPDPQYTCARCNHAFAADRQKSLPLWLKNSELSAHMSRWHCDQCLEEPTPFYTCWMPLGDLKHESSRLQVLPSSHRTVKGYHQMKPVGSGDELPQGYSASASAASRAEWVTAPADMRAGDLILFNWKLIHSATLHKGRCLRLSLDTRIAIDPERLRGDGQEDESGVDLDGAHFSGIDELSCSAGAADAANSSAYASVWQQYGGDSLSAEQPLRGRDVSLHESWKDKRRSSGHTAAEQEEYDAQYANENSMMDASSASFGLH